MSQAFRSLSQATANQVASITIAKPSGVMDGDVMVAVVVNTTVSAPSGWASVGTWGDVGGGFAPPRVNVFYKVASNEGGSYTFSVTNSDLNPTIGCIVAYSGVSVSPSPIDASGGSYDTAPNTSADSPSLPLSSTGETLVHIVASTTAPSATITSTPPSGMTERVDVAIGDTSTDGYVSMTLHLAVSDQIMLASGATGTRTSTLSTSAYTTGVSVALRAYAKPPGLHMIL